MILNDGPTPLYYQLKSIIEDRIRSRELRERERLPSEAQLCREFNVSRITVRQALAELHRDGLIHREPGRGSFVSVGAGWKRPVLKGLIENVMASGVGTQIKVLSYEEIPLPKELSKILKTRRPKRVYRLEIVRSVPEGPQGYSLIYFPVSLGGMISPDEIKETTEIISLVEQKQGIEAQGAHQAFDVCVADELLARNLSVRPGTPLLIIRREYFTTKSSLLFLAETYFRPDRFKYEIRLTRT